MAYRYRIQKLDGFTDGRPSWRMATPFRLWNRATAEETLARLQAADPMGKFRIRKVRAADVRRGRGRK